MIFAAGPGMNTALMRARATILIAGLTLAVSLPVGRGQETDRPVFRSYAGAFLAGRDHNFLVESELHLPLAQFAPVSLYYHHRETTPFLDWRDQVRAEVLHEHENFEADWALTENLRLISRAGYQASYRSDRAGQINAYTFGGGVGSPLAQSVKRLTWSALAGGYVARSNLPATWWSELFASWRLADFAREEYLGSTFRASLALTAEMNSASTGDRFGAVYRLGPELQLTTACGNRARVRLEWYCNDGNPFAGTDENGLLLGLDVTSARDDDYLWRAWETRQPGWFPLVWGGYDVGAGVSCILQHFEMNVEWVDFAIGERLLTGFTWFETRQEHRDDGYANVEYSVTTGLQSAVGLESFLSQDQTLVAGLDFLHRSDHAIDPDGRRVPRDGLIDNGSLNIFPRLRLQTLGWDLPYRDPAIYDRRNAWLHRFDWRIAAGLAYRSTRQRDQFAGQLGLNWDIAAIQGCVVYARAILSTGNNTPDWLGEIGLRRPTFKIFGRAENYGVTSTIARGETYSVGVGVNL